MPARRSAVPTGRQEAKEGQSVDPLAAKYPGWSPYNYCADNPMKFVDPNGRDYELVWDHEKNTLVIRARYYTPDNIMLKLERNF